MTSKYPELPKSYDILTEFIFEMKRLNPHLEMEILLDNCTIDRINYDLYNLSNNLSTCERKNINFLGVTIKNIKKNFEIDNRLKKLKQLDEIKYLINKLQKEIEGDS